MSLTAAYVGPIPHLRGERAMIEAFRVGRQPVSAAHRSRMIYAQFSSMTVQKRLGRNGFSGRSLRKHLGYGWHPFDVRDFKLDTGEIAEVERTCEACPSQFEGRLANGAYFYARYRGARIRIGISDVSVNAALDRVLTKDDGEVCHTRRSVSRYDGYMTWEEMEPWFVKAIAAYRANNPDWNKAG